MRPNIIRNIGQSDRAPEDRPNSKLSSHTYEKICKIGKGTYGVVYKVKDLITKEIVAMKKIKFDDKDESTPCTALREIAILKALRHENIVRLLRVEHNLSARKLYLFFEFLDCDLQRLIQDNQLTYGYVRSISEQLLVGVKYMHERLILHRDIKPHNLLVCQKSGTLKIADFGLGRPFCLPIGSLTPEIQTLWYRAPELLLGAQTYTTSVDMWAVGCVIAEMVLGKALFCEKSEIGQLFCHIPYPRHSEQESLSRVASLLWLPSATVLGANPYQSFQRRGRPVSQSDRGTYPARSKGPSFC